MRGRPARAEAWRLNTACLCEGCEEASLAGAEAILFGIGEYDIRKWRCTVRTRQIYPDLTQPFMGSHGRFLSKAVPR